NSSGVAENSFAECSIFMRGKGGAFPSRAHRRCAMFVENVRRKVAPRRGAMCPRDPEVNTGTMHPAGVRRRVAMVLQTFNSSGVAENTFAECPIFIAHLRWATTNESLCYRSLPGTLSTTIS